MGRGIHLTISLDEQASGQLERWVREEIRTIFRQEIEAKTRIDAMKEKQLDLPGVKGIKTRKKRDPVPAVEPEEVKEGVKEPAREEPEATAFDEPVNAPPETTKNPNEWWE